MDIENINLWIVEYKKTQEKVKQEKLKNMITAASWPLVKKIAYGLARRSSDPVEDIIQAGAIGLVKAIESYDIASDKDFKIYASCLITGEIRHYLRDRVSMIKPPREVQELSYRINKIAMKIFQETGENPTNEQLSDILQMPIEKIEEASDIDRRKQLVSLDQTVSFSDDSETSLSDRIPDDEYMRSADFQEIRMVLKDALDKLPQDCRRVVEMTYFDDLSLAQISLRLGISQKQVSLKYKIGMEELYKILKNE
ncbi:MAG: sigma-70 family RNA polymerase sigma factor [bacterium]|nr:sigma-70 family RNA polymerase sigma factor [bacterium]